MRPKETEWLAQSHHSSLVVEQGLEHDSFSTSNLMPFPLYHSSLVWDALEKKREGRNYKVSTLLVLLYNMSFYPHNTSINYYLCFIDKTLGLREIKILLKGPMDSRMRAPTQACVTPNPAHASPPSHAFPGSGWGSWDPQGRSVSSGLGNSLAAFLLSSQMQ